MKQTRRSALYGLVPFNDNDEDADTTRAIEAQDIQLVGGDPYYGRVEMDDKIFLVRERSPYKDDISIDDLDEDGMVDSARICASALAQTHARSDEDTGVMEGNAEEKILATIDPPVFCDDIVRFAKVAAKRIQRDFKAFQKDFELGAFNYYEDQDS